MFPTLGLFSAVRCPELSAGVNSEPCRRNPCLYSHTAPPAPVRSFSLSKRPASDTASSSSSTLKNGTNGTTASLDRPSKIRKTAVVNGTTINTSWNDDDVNSRSLASTSTSRLGPLRSTAALRKSSIEITGTGKVIRKGPALNASGTRATSSATATSHAALLSRTTPSRPLFSAAGKGKERAGIGLEEPSVTVRPSIVPKAGPPRLPISLKVPNAHTPIAVRNQMLEKFYNEFMRLYEALIPRLALTLASQHSLEQEQTVYDSNNKFSYRTSCISTIARLKKRPPAMQVEEAGTLEQYDRRVKELEELQRSKLTMEKALPLTMDEAMMKAYDYITEIPAGEGGAIPTEEGGTKTCDRCATTYNVTGNLSKSDLQACTYHWGRLAMSSRAHERVRLWSCCSLPLGSVGCSNGPHVFQERDPSDLHSRVGFIHTSDLHTPTAARPLQIAALDCEMVFTTAGASLARLTIVDGDGRIVLDEYVRPNGQVVDLVTRWSGVREADIDKAEVNLVGLRKSTLGRYITKDTILIGHGLENDLKALRLVHPAYRVIDTAQLFPHSKGLPLRNSLKNLARDHLKIFIQDNATEGHSSAIDAKTALDLVKLKAVKVAEGLAKPNQANVP